ncbi:hypothetical protein [Actinomadura rubrisoli]|nr:hypothetical protein [Actinomadura rubrisoli]
MRWLIDFWKRIFALHGAMTRAVIRFVDGPYADEIVNMRGYGSA